MQAWDFSGDEVFILFASAAIAVPGAGKFIYRFISADLVRPNGLQRTFLGLTLVSCLIFMGVSVWNFSDPIYVAGYGDYFTLFMAAGVAGLALSQVSAGWLGPHWHRDALVAGNSAAAIVCCAAMISWTFIFAGSNYGAGPTVETTLAPAWVAGAWLTLLWLIADRTLASALADAVVIDRDQATAFRLAGCLIGCSIVLARACAGDWWSWENTWYDLLLYGWPIVPLFIATGAMQQYWQPTPQTPRRERLKYGIAPAAMMIVVALIYVSLLPKPTLEKHIVTWQQYTGEKE